MIEVESSLEASRRRPIPKLSLPIPAIRVTSQFDSESCSFLHKISCKLFHGLAKLKLSFHNNPRNGQISHAQLGFINKYLSIIFHLQDCNALLTTSFDIGTRLEFRAVQDLKRGQTGQPKYFHIGYSTKHLSLSCTSDDDKSVVTRINLGSILLFKCHHKKAQEGEVAIVASLTDPSYKLELASTVPSIGLQRASFRFPLGEVTVEKREDEVRRNFLINGNLKGQVMDGVCTILHKDNDFNLSYSYKDEEKSFVPIISFPSNVLSFVFKRRFSPSGKLRFCYTFNSRCWNAIYKHTIGNDLKVKTGYDSEVRLARASLWVGEENSKITAAPMKMKVQLTLEVAQDDISSSIIMFRVKKRWNF